MRLDLVGAALSASVLLACGTPAPAGDAGTDSGVALDGGADGGSDAGTDAGVLKVYDLQERACDGLLGSWDLDAGVQAAWDAGGFSPCLPLPPLGPTISLTQGTGVWTAPRSVSWATDAGCQLAVDYSFSSTNPSETYTHAVHLQLDLADAGLLLGGGTYRLSGGSNCTVPLEAVGVRVP